MIPSFLRGFVGLALLAALGLVGCRSVKVDPEGKLQAAYQFGNFDMLVNAPVDPTFKAVQSSLARSELFEVRSKKNRYDGWVRARTRDDRLVTISIREVNSRQALVRIRWGETGDQRRSTDLFRLIEDDLNQAGYR